MTLSQAIQVDGQALHEAAHEAICKAMLTAWRQKATGKRRPSEPEFVACLALFAAPDFAAEWKQILRTYGVQLAAASVFCHARPIVDTHDSKGAELGDILFVHRHQDIGGNVRRNALLFQAKVSSRQPHTVGNKEGHQLRLYQGWPDFVYVTPQVLSGHARHVQPKTWHPGAQYLQLDPRPPSNRQSGLKGWPEFPAGACLPNSPLRIHADLGLELLAWLCGLSGRSFCDKATAAKSDGWSRVIWDLLGSSLGQALKWKRRFYGGRPRYSGDHISLLDGCFASDGRLLATCTDAVGEKAQDLTEPPRDNDDARFREMGEDDAGISTVVIETSDAEYREE